MRIVNISNIEDLISAKIEIDNWLIDNKEDQPFDQVIQSKPTIPVLYWSGTMTSFPEGKLAATDIKELIMNY